MSVLEDVLMWINICKAKWLSEPLIDLAATVDHRGFGQRLLKDYAQAFLGPVAQSYLLPRAQLVCKLHFIKKYWQTAAKVCVHWHLFHRVWWKKQSTD